MVKGLKNEVWTAFLESDPTFYEKLNQKELIEFTAKEVNMISKELRGPDFRNLSKFDKREDLPDIFIEQQINIVPLSTSKYIIGNMEEYAEFKGGQPDSLHQYKVPELLTLQGKVTNWNENSWISAAIAVGGFQNAFDETELVRTLNGWMGGGRWQFNIASVTKDYVNSIILDNPQIEIDAILESGKAIYVIEAKRVKESNFLVRQLYFPYRKLLSDLKIWNKPIYPVFFEIDSAAQYARIRVFEFVDASSYNSINEVKRFEFQLIDNEVTDATKDGLLAFAQHIETRQTPAELFPQANDMSKIITLLVELGKTPMKNSDIAVMFGFDPRQSDYYGNFLLYFNLVQKNIEGEFELSLVGRQVASLSGVSRNLAIVHEIFHTRLFNRVGQAYLKGHKMNGIEIVAMMRDEHLQLGESTMKRRASTVVAMMEWMVLQVTD
ncbi:type II restriction enzyme [Weissella soli]|uniref:type II restriction enzyme n=1 Tax=Weissella soli TaxID=155866 RepID=UPI0011BAEEBF|nr:hypothetical protein [Weissella soli]QEA35005.1 hypothetical protein FGL88_04190 [Weissella soli]